MTPPGPAVSAPLWEELFMGTGQTVAVDPDVAACTLSPRYEAVKDARDFARSTLLRWGLAELFDDVALVASELVTNALRHALELRADAAYRQEVVRSGLGPNDQRRGQEITDTILPIRISLVHRSPQVVCAVSDPSSAGPIAREPDFIAESGRGLHLVNSFSRSWGWHPLAGTGKVVWALFDAPQDLNGDTGGRHRRSPLAG